MSLKFTAGHFSSLAVFSTRSVFQAKKRNLFQENVLFWALGGRKTHSELTGSTEWNPYFTKFGEFFSSLTKISFEQISSTQKPLPKRAFYQKTAWIRATTNFQDLSISSKMILLTLSCPIGLPPHALVAQKNADQRWLIANLSKNRYIFYIKWCD